MLIGTKWKIEANKYNILLYKKYAQIKGKNQGVEQWKVEGYFRTVAGALKFLVDSEVKETQLRDLKTVVAKQDELYKLIEGLKDLPKQEALIHHRKAIE